MSSYVWIYSHKIQTNLQWAIISPIRNKDNILHLIYEFAPQSSKNMPLYSQMGFLVSKICILISNYSNYILFLSNECNYFVRFSNTSSKIFKHLNHSNKIFFTSNLPYTLKYIKLHLLQLKIILKTLKSNVLQP